MRRNMLVRVLPMAAFMALLAVRGWAGDEGFMGIDGRWLYAAQAAVVALMLAVWWRDYGELSWQLRPSGAELGLSVAVGLAVFVLWIQLDAPWMTIGSPTASFVPRTADGQLDWALIAVRAAGAALVVPLMEELFWRSFLMRWVDDVWFERVDPMRVTAKAVVLSTFAFVLVHTLWLAAAVAGLAYAWLYRRTGKLWTSVIAHAVTNAALALWVVKTGQWQFW